MQILVNTDRNVYGHEALAERISAAVEYSLCRFSEHITRIEIHLSDEDGGGKLAQGDKRCVMEARLEGRKPVAVTDTATTLEQATIGAVDKLTRMIERDRGRVARQDHTKLGSALSLGPDESAQSRTIVSLGGYWQRCLARHSEM